MAKETIHLLFDELTRRRLTPEEESALNPLWEDPSNEELAKELLENWYKRVPPVYQPVAADSERVFRAILGKESAIVHRIHLIRRTWFRYAAVLLLIAGSVTLYFTYNTPQKEITKQQLPFKQPDILPGGNKAILTLSDGSSIILDSAAIGAVAQQGATRIIKIETGKLAYQVSVANGEILHNTIRTPKGGQYQIVLPDGTKVWLNAASSIRFPTRFEHDRVVEISGESYLEIAPDKNKPFFVKTEVSTIEVLGTCFNVHAYPDEVPFKTTLIEGRIKVGQSILQPGQAYQGGKVVAAQIEQDLAWKNGIFNFNRVSLQQAMRQLARWYDVEVIYEGTVPTILFYGEMGRNLELSEVLASLKQTGVHFRLEGRRLIVTP